MGRLVATQRGSRFSADYAALESHLVTFVRRARILRRVENQKYLH